jgi:crotonobetainyl-CoA:carnitine CoA-transferase CaiB-like acyl-CoA transferase
VFGSGASLEAPLKGIRVVELADYPAGESVGRVLAQTGADVIKVELPEGAASRKVGPYAGGHENVENSLAFAFYNVNKRSVVIDYRTDSGKLMLKSILESADVCLTSFQPAEARRIGLEGDSIRALSDSLIVVSITPFGLSGPWADRASSDLVALALGGMLNLCGYDDHSIPPIRPGGDQAYQTAGSFALIGLMLALLERQQTGIGQLVDISLHNCVAVGGELANPYWFYNKALVQRQTCRHAQPTPTQPALFQCGDGRSVYLLVTVADQKTWDILVGWMASMGVACDLDEPEYSDPRYRQERFPYIQGIIESFFLLKNGYDAYTDGQERGLPIGILNAPEDVFTDEHLAAREFFATLESADGWSGRYPTVPLRFSAFGSATPQRAPSLGEHTEEVLS